MKDDNKCNCEQALELTEVLEDLMIQVPWEHHAYQKARLVLEKYGQNRVERVRKRLHALYPQEAVTIDRLIEMVRDEQNH